MTDFIESNVISVYHSFCEKLMDIDTKFNNDDSIRWRYVNESAKHYEHLKRFFSLHGYTVAYNLEELRKALQKLIGIIYSEDLLIVFNNSFTSLFNQDLESITAYEFNKVTAYVFPNGYIKFEKDKVNQQVHVTLQEVSCNLQNTKPRAAVNVIKPLDTVPVIDGHYKSFETTFRIRQKDIDENVDQIFQSYGYTYADSYDTLTKKLKKRLKEAFDVDTAEFNIIVDDINCKFDNVGTLVFKTARLQMSVRIEQNTKTSQFNKYIKKWRSANDEQKSMYEERLCKMLRKDTPHSMQSVVIDPLLMDKLDYCVAQNEHEFFIWAKKREIYLDKVNLTSKLGGYFNIPGIYLIVHKNWVESNFKY